MIKKNNYELDIFNDLLRMLHDHYEYRYYDNKVSGKGASGTELIEIDRLWVYLVKILPMPDEVKYRMKFFTDLFDAESRKHWQNFKWITENNKALILEIRKMGKKYKELEIG